MSDRLNAIRSVASKTTLGLTFLSVAVLGLAACGGSSTAGTSVSNPGLTACSVTPDQLVSGPGGTGTATKAPGATGKLSIDGSSALQPLVQAAAAEFDLASGTSTSVAAGGSGQGLKDVAAGAVQIGMSDVFASEKLDATTAATLTDHQVAVVAFTLATSNDLAGKVDNLTSDEITKIFTGETTNWSQIGGPNEPITVINRPTASGTRSTFDKWVLKGTKETAGQTLTEDNTGAVATAVKATPGSIGYISIGFVTGSNKGDLHPICIDGGKAVAADISAGKYQFWGVEHMYTKGPAASVGYSTALMQYIVSSEVQTKDLVKLGYIAIGDISATAITAHTPAGSPAPESLS